MRVEYLNEYRFFIMSPFLCDGLMGSDLEHSEASLQTGKWQGTLNSRLKKNRADADHQKTRRSPKRDGLYREFGPTASRNLLSPSKNCC